MDQRGVFRPLGLRCDIGAFEFEALGKVVPSQLTVNGAGTGSRVVAAVGIDCVISAGSTSGTCTNVYAADFVVSLAAIPTAGSVFTGWSGDCASPGGPGRAIGALIGQLTNSSIANLIGRFLPGLSPAASVRLDDDLRGHLPGIVSSG